MIPAFKRAVLYARYSTDMQQERSIEDQFALCRDYAARHGIVIVGEYYDRERTSATLFDRTGLIQLMRDASQGRFNMVLTEHYDRLSRDGEDLFGLYKRLTYAGVEMHSVSQGAANEAMIGVFAITGSMFLKGLSEKVRRGLSGRAREGKIVAGVTYGYRVVQGKPGQREIDPEQAEVVKRVFMEYIGGASPRSIAMRLQAEGIPAPGRTPWSYQNISGGASTLAARGIVNNRMYLGEIAYGRTKEVLNPSTGRKIRRKAENPIIVIDPSLRIISDDLWEAAQKIREGRIKVSGKPRKLWSRNDGILAGIVNCAVCGAHMVVSNRSRDGSGRFSCSAAYYRSACEHSKSYDAPRLERAVLDRLAAQLADPRLIKLYVDEYLAERRVDQRNAQSERDAILKRLDEIEVETMRLATALQKGTMPERILVPLVEKLETERVGLAERKRVAEQTINVVDLHPSVIAQYKQAVETLQAELQSSEQTPEARIAFRTLVESITVLPTPARAPYQFRINGRLGALQGVTLFPTPRKASEVLIEQGVTQALACTDSRYPGKAG